ncbi:T9SS type A sorting domain-containing protein [bacterium]|nr:T9SS type A sorting domain-containing protein [bacterium]
MQRFVLILAGVLLLVAGVFAQTPIADIQTVTDPENDDASPMVGETVTIQGWVTFEPMSAGGSSFYVADAAGAWNGINVFDADNSHHLGFGYEVEVTGEVTEYFGKTEIVAPEGGELEVTILNDMVDWENLPPAVAYTEVSAADLAGGAATAEQYEGVLVKVLDVETTDTDLGYGEWEVGDGSGNNFAIDDPQDDVFGYAFLPQEDYSFEYVQGILNYTFDVYKVMPEIAYDLKVQEDVANGIYTPIAWFQQVRPMDMTVQYDENGDPYTNDYSYASGATRWGNDLDPATITVHGLVTAPTGLYYAGDGVKFIMADFDHGMDEEGYAKPWSAVLSYDPDSTAFPALEIGDEITFQGHVDEYLTGAGHMTEMWIEAAVNPSSIGNTTPIPPTIDTEDVRNPMHGEMWGNVFVHIENSVVIHPTLQYQMFAIDNNLEDDWLAIKVDDDSDSLTSDSVIVSQGAVVESITGWIYHHYGDLGDEDGSDWPWKIVPQGPSDIILGETPPIFLSVGRNPGAPGADEDVTVTAEIADNSQITSAMIYYAVGEGSEYETVAMTNVGGIEWEGTIPGQPEGTDVWYYLWAEDDSETNATYPDDIEASNFGYWNTDNLGIYEVQYTPFPSGNSPYNGNFVTLEGVVTTSPAGFEHYGAYFLQIGDEAPYSGICATIPDSIATLRVGDHVRVTGDVDESGMEWGFKWGENTKLVNVIDCQVLSRYNDYQMYATDIASINAALEAHESVVVELSNVEVTDVNQYDWSITDDSGEEFLLDDDLILFHEWVGDWFGALAEGTEVGTISGVVTYSFGTWKLEPRFPSDISTLNAPESESSVPNRFFLAQNYPNPFNPTTSISYGLPMTGEVQMVVYNALGQQVKTLVNAVRQAGNHTVTWNGTSDNGIAVASGVYFVRLSAGDNTQVRKMVLTK